MDYKKMTVDELREQLEESEKKTKAIKAELSNRFDSAAPIGDTLTMPTEFKHYPLFKFKRKTYDDQGCK